VRSGHATAFLRQRGFSDVTNLAGGIDAWAREVDQSVPRY
jgi:rhodanese-related sulfurtransferase